MAWLPSTAWYVNYLIIYFVGMEFTNDGVFMQQALIRARQLVLADQARYKSAWLAILNEPAEKPAVAALCLYVQELAMRLTQRPLQLNRAHEVPETAMEYINSSALQSPVQRRLHVGMSRTPSFTLASLARNSISRRQAWKGLLDCGVDGVMDPQRPIDSLDQLYCQAVALSPILVAKVQKWASASCGCFYSAATSTSFFQRVGA
jgi:hypothetical protein